MREVNQAARDLIIKYEGCLLKRYDDGAGLKTIGIGHKITPDDNIGDTITQEQANQLFERDLANASISVEQLVTIDINDNQFGALVSFTFNLGAGSLARSTLLKLVDEGDFAGAAEQFARWVDAGDEVEEGLVERREAEKQLFLT
jgi:lysozyme